MRKDAVILIAEDDDGHFLLLERNLRRSGINNEIIRFVNGNEVLNFLNIDGDGVCRRDGVAYLLILDLRLPEIDGLEVLKKLKSDTELKKMPIVTLTAASDTEDSNACYDLGSSIYVIKPAEYETFVETVKKIGSFLGVIEVPVIGKLEPKA